MADGSEDPDADTAARFRSGDESALSEMMTKYRDRMERVAYRYVRNSEDAKDVAQITFARAFEKRESYRAEAAFATWLFRIAINVSLNYVRAKSVEVNLQELDDVAAFTHSLKTSKLVAAEVWRRVIDKLDALPPKQRLVVELRLFHELAFEEVGTIAGCSEESAKANYHHGIKALRASIPEPGSS